MTEKKVTKIETTKKKGGGGILKMGGKNQHFGFQRGPPP